MKKIILAVACCAALLSTSNVAYTAEATKKEPFNINDHYGNEGKGVYASANIGIASLNDADVVTSDSNRSYESDIGLAVNAAIGYDFGSTRLEGEISYQENDLDKRNRDGETSVGISDGDSSSTAFLINGYFDFENESSITPFISLGVGWAKIKVSDIETKDGDSWNTSGDDIVLAYQIGAGLGFAVTNNAFIDIKYRYFGTDDVDLADDEVEYSSHNLYVGTRVHF